MRVSQRQKLGREPRCGSRGMGIGSILLLLAVFSILLFTAVSAGLSHLRVVEMSVRQEHARNLAEAALSQALSNLVATDFAFGRDGNGRVEIRFDDLPDGVGVVTFDRGELSKGYSTYNLTNDGDVRGASDTLVPGQSVHLVARGKVGSAERWMECYYHKPPFPDGLVTQGPIKASELYLLGVRSTRAYLDHRPGPVPPEEILPANLFSNSAVGFQPGEAAASIGQRCLIKGSAGAFGSVAVDTSALIEGEVLPGSDKRPIPDLDIEAKIATISEKAVPVQYSGGDLNLLENWFGRSLGDLHVSGDINMNGTALVVNGDLDVNGAVKGAGFILVRGDVRLRRGAQLLSPNNQVALACHGDITLDGTSKASSFFQGLVYCEGDLTASDITVVGATVVNGKPPARGFAKIDNADFIQTPGSVTMTLRRPQGRDFKPEGNGDGHWFAVSLTLREAPDGEGYLCDARTYFCDAGKAASQAPDNPLAWRDHFPGTDPNRRQKGVDRFRSESFPNIYIGNPTPSLVREKLSDPIKAWLRACVDEGFFKGWKDEDGVFLEPALWSYVNAMATGTPDQYISTFNLNSLMREVTGTSRVLAWRPFHPK